MNVDTYNPNISDIHSAIAVTLQNDVPNHKHITCAQNINIPSTNQISKDHFKVGPWEQNKAKEFIKNIDNVLLHEINQHLDQFHDCDNRQTRVDLVMDKICDLFVKAGIDTFGKKSFKMAKSKNSKNKTKPTTHRPWYNQTCRNKKVIFNKARKNIKF